MTETTKNVTATWCIELNCDCPHCDEYVNVLDGPDFWDGRHLELAEHGTERSKHVETVCPKCSKEFEVCCDY